MCDGRTCRERITLGTRISGEEGFCVRYLAFCDDYAVLQSNAISPLESSPHI